MALFSPLTIDTIEMTATIPSLDLYKALWSQLMAVHEDAKDLWPPGWKTRRSSVGHSAVRVTINPAWKRPVAAFEIGTSKTKHRWMKVALFPNNFIGQEWSLVQSRMAVLFQAFGYETFFFEARVTRVDLAIDTYSHALDSLLPYRPTARKSKRYQEATGELGTLYLGSVSSAVLLRIYDKKKQLHAKKAQEVNWKVMTRFEATVRGVGCAACDLPEKLVNPFQDLYIVRRAEAHALHPNDSAWCTFVGRASQIGTAGALFELSAKQRKVFRKRLVGLGNKLALGHWADRVSHAVQRIAPDPGHCTPG